MLPAIDSAPRQVTTPSRLPGWYPTVFGPSTIRAEERVDIPDIQESSRVTFSDQARVTPGTAPETPRREDPSAGAIALYLNVQRL
jgi:hypothetical protein